MIESVPERKKAGRKVGWRKTITLTCRLTTRIPQHLEDWLKAEAELKGLSASDIARLLLLDAKQRAEEAAAAKKEV